MAVGQPQGMLLNEFGDFISKSFGTLSVYHVGSSMGDNKKDWRDVDIRLMLTDDEWSSLFGDLHPIDCHRSQKWRSFCIVFSHYGKHLTGLPIDFQIQRIKEANDEFDSPRSHVGTHNFLKK